MKNATRASILKAVVILLYAAVILPFLRSGVPGTTTDTWSTTMCSSLFVPLLLILAVFRDQPEEMPWARVIGGGAAPFVPSSTCPR